VVFNYVTSTDCVAPNGGPFVNDELGTVCTEVVVTHFKTDFTHPKFAWTE